MSLLCLFMYDVSFSQSCVSIGYDENGNRTQLTVDNCGAEKDIIKKDIRLMMPEKEYADGFDVYPNPTDGIINVKTNAGNELLSRYELYNVKGLLLNKSEFQNEVTIDIGNQPAGVYLLKIISGDDMCSDIIVKL